MKILDFVIALVIICIFLIGVVIGMRLNTEQIVITMDDPEMLKLAMEYHGITKCKVTIDGIYYFVRDSKWCSLYSIPFREWYRERE